MHAGLVWAFGRAAEHLCSSCLGPALDWAYLHDPYCVEIIDEQGRKYTEDLSGYTPMCRSCHRSWDISNDPGRIGFLSSAWVASLPLEHLQEMRARAAINAAKVTFSRPGHRAVLSEAAKKRFKANPLLREEMSKRGRAGGIAVVKQRRRCGDCPVTTVPGALANHQRASGHEGWSPE